MKRIKQGKERLWHAEGVSEEEEQSLDCNTVGTHNEKSGVREETPFSFSFFKVGNKRPCFELSKGTNGEGDLEGEETGGLGLGGPFETGRKEGWGYVYR